MYLDVWRVKSIWKESGYKNSICTGTAQAAYDSCTDAAQPKEESFGGFTLTVYQEESSIGAMTAFIYELYGQHES